MGKYFYKHRDERLKVVEQIFDKEAKDLSYISSSKLLLKRHKIFINKIRYVKNSSLYKYKVPTGKYEGMCPMPFMNFEEFYPEIFAIWMHIIRSCFDNSYRFYPYFGGKGIYPGADVLDSKRFALWCLRNGYTGKAFTYTKYLQRKDKSKGYTLSNCYITTEASVHSPTNLSKVIEGIRLIKLYEDEHDSSVSYISFYTRYYLYDMDEYSARIAPYPDIPGFMPTVFYNSVADESSCSYSTFISRMHYSYLNGGYRIRPYELLDHEYSVCGDCNRQGKLSYKQLYERNKKEASQKYCPYTTDEAKPILEDSDYDVYSNNDDIYS